MKIERVFTVFVAVFIVLALIYMFTKNSGDSTGITAEAQVKEAQQHSETQFFDPKTTGSMGAGDALIELTPRSVDKNRLVVNFSINTHSVSLSRFNLKEITVLEHQEHVFKPVKSSSIGGHHSTGVIVFDVGDRIGNKDSFKIRLRGIPKVQDRVYEWS